MVANTQMERCPRCKSDQKDMLNFECFVSHGPRNMDDAPHDWHSTPAAPSKCPRCGSVDPDFREPLLMGTRTYPCNNKFHDRAPAAPETAPESTWPPKGRVACANCNALIKSNQFSDGLEIGETGVLPCGHVFCWHCDDNRGRAEDHECGFEAETIPAETVAYWQHRALESEAKLKEYKEAAYRLENTIRLLRAETPRKEQA